MSDDEMKRVHDKLDRLIDTIGEINVTVAKQEINVREHMRRTENLETRVLPLETYVSSTQSNWAFARSGAKFLGGLVAAFGTIFGALKYLKLF